MQTLLHRKHRGLHFWNALVYNRLGDFTRHLASICYISQISYARVDYSAADTSRFNIVDEVGLPVGFVDFTTEFKYLGSILHHSLTSDADVDKRIKSATAAFGLWST